MPRCSADGWLITGSRQFLINAPEAGLLVVFARTGPEATYSCGISVFLVETSVPGVRTGPPDEKPGQRGAHTAEAHFNTARVPATVLFLASDMSSYTTGCVLEVAGGRFT